MFRDRVLLALIAVGAIVRFATLDAQSFWFDEALTVNLVDHSFGGMIREVLDTQAQPPPYFIAAWAWVRVFGDGEVGLRSLSALFGTLTVPVVWATAMHVGGRRVAIVAATLTALSPPLIWYSQEARGYSLVVLCAALSLLFFVRAADDPSRRNLSLWVAASLLAVAAHYFALFAVLPEAAWLLFRALDRPRALRYGGALGVGLLVLAPFLLYQREHGGAEWIGGEEFYPRLRDAAVFLISGHHIPGPIENRRGHLALLGFIVFCIVAVAGWKATTGAARRRFALVLGVGLVAVALPLLAAAGGSDFVLDRNFLPAWVPLTIAASVGLCSVRFRLPGAIILVGTVALFAGVATMIPRVDRMQRDHWRTVAERIGPLDEDEVVETVPFWQGTALQVYAPGLEPMRAPRRVSKLHLVSYIGFLPYNQPIRPVPPPPPFRETRHFWEENIEVIEYTAPEPVVLDPRSLRGEGRNRAVPYALRVG